MIEDNDEPDDWYLLKLRRSEAPALTVAIRDKRIFSTGCSGTPNAIRLSLEIRHSSS